MSVLEVKTKVELDALAKAHYGKIMVIDYYTSWCGPCKQLAPILDNLAKKYLNIVFVKLNVENEQGLGISTLPTIQIIQNGQQLELLTGYNPNLLIQTIAELKY